jgi:hypothetical protein
VAVGNYISSVIGDDNLVSLVVLSVVLFSILGPTTLIVWLLVRALRRLRALDLDRVSPRGFDVVSATQTKENRNVDRTL